ncbi:DUF4180 domain-containing protein [Xenorhabdus sp. KJ12.1]|uniref:DUF4180 domain-containing protein n=1 Tax=Xenorhabdus sp. KJ12.1 TaxID=1851571 RepID=UPI00350EB340
MILSHECRNIAGFILKTEIAGEILQAFVNYRVKIAILRDITKCPHISTSLRDFVCGKSSE